jgi:L-serine/L-threonine ammonia-lyase
VCDAAFAWSQKHPIRSVLVSDASALAACERFLADQRILVEPACGAALALAYDHPSELADYNKVLFIVCGGATATLAQIQQWAKQQVA